ncbi:hypothetical protein DXX93_12310 [Thalassotalea euphylliae]|uniref:Uncharacterized protein n=1 Tax=Thalassotalea euphylliae TaxID=1655234 RepID=A0A3E0TS15_9GAMM|nr:hypothetical protein [Thalassotalea euphylliae]REL27273.1 hypothetical protein DXX93_12310 [Thalassotalea euphylliae]
MQVSNHYLYQYAKSKNLYFRMRIPTEYVYQFDLTKKHFTATLKTDDITDARWLALFIKNKIKRELKQLVLGEDSKYQASNWDFYGYLRTKFETYLGWGKKLLASQSFADELNQIPAFTDDDNDSYAQYLEKLMSGDKEDLLALNKQIAHKPYMMNYYDAYSRFLTSSFYTDIHKKNPNTPNIDKPSAAESFFGEQHYDEDFYQAFQDPESVYDPQVIKRFIARHAYIELDFKKHLMKELKSFKQDYNPFADDVNAKAFNPVEYNSFLELIETIKETQQVIADFKSGKIAEAEKENSIPLKETYEAFIAEKAKSVKSNSIDLYNISFNFLYTLIGEDFDIQKFDKKKAIEIKEAVLL